MDSPELLLQRAAEAGNAAEVRAALAAGADPNAPLGNGSTAPPLHLAAMNGHIESATALLEGGADPNVRTDNGDTPLLWAIVFDQMAAVAALLAAGADPALMTSGGQSSTHVAAMDGNVPILRSLLAAEPSLALLRDHSGRTPLRMALLYGWHDAARCLLEEAPLQPVGEILFMLVYKGAWAAPLCAPLVARTPLTADQWARIPTPCPGLGVALPAVLQRSTAEAVLLVRHLPPIEQARLRALALCLHRAATRRPTRRSPRLPALPTPLVWRLLALSASHP